MNHSSSWLLLLAFLALCFSTVEGTVFDRWDGEDDSVVTALSLEEKVGQLFFTLVYGETLSKESKEFLTASKVGNVIYYAWANGLCKKSQVKTLSQEIQDCVLKSVGIPAFIGIDQEGGRVSRLSGEFTLYPGAALLGATKDEEMVRKNGFLMAQEMQEVGITLDFAPVVDVNTTLNNPIIGNRAFSDRPEEVVCFAQAMIEGLHRGHVMTCLKHFPGHGDTVQDSHTGIPVITKKSEELFSCELQPFIALHKETEAIMTSHCMVPSLDPKHSATFSFLMLTDLLRQKIGFQGLIISDSLVMKGAAPHQHTFQEAAQEVAGAAIRAFQAGCDCLLLGRLEWADFPEKTDPVVTQRLVEYVLCAFQEEVRRGTISEARLNASVERILRCKKRSTTYAK